jgi:hypothetical protein
LGVNKNTAATQYSLWRAEYNRQLAAELANQPRTPEEAPEEIGAE